MSIESMALVLNHSQAKGTDKLVLLGIANHQGDGGAWPTLATLARYANCSERTVQRSISVLVDLGELLVEVNSGGTMRTDPRYRPNRYEVVLRCPADCDGSMQHRVGSGATSVSSLAGGRGDIPDVLGATPLSSEPSIQPSIKESVVGDAVAPPTLTQRAQRITKAYTDRVPLSKFPAVMSIVGKALKTGLYDDGQVEDALVRLAEEGRPVTVDTLRIEMEGLPGRRSGSRMYADVLGEIGPQRALGGS